jgi:hypothetical protein
MFLFRSFKNAQLLVSRKDELTLSTLEQHIEMERENDSKLLQQYNTNKQRQMERSKRLLENLERGSQAQQQQNDFDEDDLEDDNIFARGLKVFDPKVHMVRQSLHFLAYLISYR